MGHLDPSGGGDNQAAPKVIPFGKYLLLDRIAVGGMAEVYTAKSFGVEGFEKIIAIKRILPTMAEDRDFISMFIDEAKIAGHLTHANIVPIYELGKVGESHYIAMEYVWGKDLLQIMNRFRRMRRYMPPVMAAWIASKMLEGLDYAHRKRDRHGRPMGIIHRDVSPQNCLVSYEGQVKLIDFGIAKAASRTTTTQAGVLKGKFGYMSPEQVRGNPVDHRSDIFAASTCLHEMLTGERLFVGESDFSTLEKVRNAGVVPPSAVVPEMPRELEEILMKGLACNPDERWQTAGEMQEALQRFIAAQRPPFGTSKLNTWMRTAFAQEIAKEKARLDSFARLGPPPSTATAPAAQPRVPALASTSPQSPAARRNAAPPSPKLAPSLDDFADLAMLAEDEEELVGEATVITASPFDAVDYAAEVGDLAGHATEVFFTARELEGPRDVEPAAAAPAGSLSAAVATQAPSRTPAPLPMAAATAGSRSPKPAPSPTPTVRIATPSPPLQPQTLAPQTTVSPAPDVFAPPPPTYRSQRDVPTAEVLRPVPATRTRSGMVVLLAVAAVVAAVFVAGMVGAAIVLFGGEPTGTILVRVQPETADARVFVDGVQRGRAPLRLEHVPEGEHTIEVRAEGFQVASRSVPVTGNGTALLEIALQANALAAAPPASDAAPPAPAPVLEPVPAAPLVPAVNPAPTVAVAPAVAVPGSEHEPAPAPVTAAPRGPEPSPNAARAEADSRPEQAAAERIEERSARSRSDEPASEARRREHGYVTIQTIPWARVFVDGRDTGRNTPVRDLRVPAGRRTIGLRTNDGTMHTVQVNVEPGESTRIARQL